MKKEAAFLTLLLSVFTGLFILTTTVHSQQLSNQSSALPDEINKIVTNSCTPCHTSTGSLKSRIKLNFDKWTDYSAGTKKEKAAKMYEQLKKGDMPPKSAREKHPELIPTAEQISIIKKWSESFSPEVK